MHWQILLSIFVMVGEVFTIQPPFPRQDDVPKALPEGENVIPDQYLIELSRNVVTKSDKQAVKDTMATKYGLNVEKEVTIGDLKIMMVSGDKASMEAASVMPQIASYSPHYMYSINQDVASCNKRHHPYTWGLDRIDQREFVTEESLSENTTYTYGLSDAGQGVSVYVLDTGIDINHPEFEGRAWWGFTSDNMDGDVDLNGHGTHVAGTIGSASFGVAKRATLVAVKVLSGSGSGTTMAVIEGLSWVLTDHIENFLTSGIVPKSVINMSLGSRVYDPIYTAVVNEVIKFGITVVVSAGNDNEDACFQMPASVPDAITVGASNVNDQTTDFSNWGECVDIYAPGHDILSTYPHSLEPAGVEILPGTSMAAPHVAGVVARYQSTQAQAKSPAEVTDWLLDGATKDALKFYSSDHATSPNKLLFMSCDPSASGSWKMAGLWNLVFGMVLACVIIQ